VKRDEKVVAWSCFRADRSGSGKISVITVNGDKASVAVIKEGLKTPTAVEPAGDTIWVAERGAGKTVSIPK